jgi:cell division protein FtsL
MSVASLLDRKVDTAEETAQSRYNVSTKSQDELHNSRISENYKKLLDPNYKMEDEVPQQTQQPVQMGQYGQVVSSATQLTMDSAPAQSPRDILYRVENARADADIFRADNAINRRIVSDDSIIVRKPAVQQTTASATKDEDNEDLRPTQTTIQYQTIKEDEPAKTTNATENKEKLFGKKEKAIIATFIGIVAALVVLVVVNSIIIANLNHNLANLQGGLITIKIAASNMADTIASITDPENIAQFAASHNMSLR